MDSKYIAPRCLAVALLGIGFQLEAATADNNNFWLNYVGDHPLLSSPWGVHLEVQNRLSDWGKDWQQLLVRPGINYQIDPHWSVSAGYAYVRTDRYGELPVARSFDENRIWEQVQYKGDWLGIGWTHRVRFEQRWIEELRQRTDDDFETANWRGEQRASTRYRLDDAQP